ncbi:hypothetical protein SHIRM173S_09535 [Streptomyces hirsutus]
MLQPGLAEGGELSFEPAADHVDREAAVRQMVGGCAELRQDTRVPEPGVDGGDDFQTLGGQQQREAETGGLVLVFGTVTGHVTHLAEGVVEAVVLGEDSEFPVVLVSPVGTLFDGAGDQASADIGDPVGEFHGICGHAELLLRNAEMCKSGCEAGVRARRIHSARKCAESGRCEGKITPGGPKAATTCGTGGGGSGESGRDATGGAGNAREVDVASPREVQSLRHAVDRGSPRSPPSRKTRPFSHDGPLNFTNM